MDGITGGNLAACVQGTRLSASIAVSVGQRVVTTSTVWWHQVGHAVLEWSLVADSDINFR